MFIALSSALTSFDRICGQFAALIQSSQPQIYGSILLVVLFWCLSFPPKNDSDQI